MKRASKTRLLAVPAAVALLAGTAALPAVAKAGPAAGENAVPVFELSGPRGVSSFSPRMTLVTQDDGTFGLVMEHPNKDPRYLELGSVGGGFSNALDHRGAHVYILTGGGPPGSGAATLYHWNEGMDAPEAMADIGAYQETDPDPFNLADPPGESNPFGVAALPGGAALVSDAAANDLLKVRRNGSIVTVARLKPRMVEVPEGLPPTDPDGNPLPPAGAIIPSEAVATSVTVGADGYYYVGELRGFPATPGTSQIWRINPNAQGAICDPENPHNGPCQLYADGFTSIV